MSTYLRKKTPSLSRRLLLALTVMSVMMLWTCALLPGAASGPDDGGDVGPASPGPDMNATATDIVLSDTTPQHGQNVTIQVTVRNTGDEAAINCTVDIYDGNSSSGKLLMQSILPSVAAGGSTTVSTIWAASIGDHTITMSLDKNDWITEDSETNNKASIPVTVGGIPDVRMESGAFLVSTNQEGNVVVTADAFNGGNATASGYKMAFYHGDPDTGGTLIGRPVLPAIPPGGRATAQQSWAATGGEHHLFGRVESTDPLDPLANNGVNQVVWIASDLTARAGPDQAAFAGQNLTFNGTASTSVDDTIVNYTWDMGDGTTLYGAVVTHGYTNSGTTVRTLTARLTVKDGSGATDADTCRVYINPLGSSPPTADAGTPPSGTTRQNMSFDGSGSTGTITTYTWDFGDGSGASGASATVNHSYMDDGVYTVSLAVMSNVSLVDVDVIQVTVTNQGPVVEAIADISTDVGVAHDLLVLASDADGYIASYLWDFGDGTTSSLRDPTHTWTSDGPHLASVNVTDDDGAYTVVTFWVNVTDVVPTAYFNHDLYRYEGQTLRVDGSGTSEPGGDIVSWQWDWESDGTFDNTTGPASGFIYTKPGYYNITLRVTDGEGSTNDTTREVLILNVAPTAACSIADRTVMEGENVTYDCSGSSEPGDDIIRYFFDWESDGVYDFNTTEPVVNHTFFTVGIHTATVVVVDEDGTYDDYTSFWWMRVTVSNAPPLVNASESSGPEGENITVTVDAYEPGNNLVDFYWDFDGDYLPDVHTNTPYVNHTFWEAGIHWVWVNVTDEDHTDTTPSWGGGEIKVNVSDVAPKPSVEGGSATEGEAAAFTVTMRGTEENISTFHFDLDGDGDFEVKSTLWTTMLTFTHTGEIECLVRVVDTDGTEGIALFNVYVYDVAPTVRGPAFMLVAEGEDMILEVTAEEPGMDIVRYEFDWNADGIADDTTTEPMATHSYMSQGAKRIVVTVVDEDGSVGTVGIQVLVANTPPTADAGTPSQSFEGDPVELNASMSTEPGMDIVAYEWDYDADGLFDFTTRDPAHHHSWDVPGLYTIVVRVIDEDGTFDEDTATVVIEDREPVAALSVDVRPEDMLSLLDASASMDPGGITLYEWNITAPGQRLDIATTVPFLSFSFDRKVRYDITLTVTDHEGSKGDVDYVVAIEDVISLPPTVTWEAPTLVMEGDMFTVRAWADDPFPDDPDMVDGRLFEYSWNMGDGSAVRHGDVVTHSYDRAGAQPYEVTLTVIDEDNDRVTLMVANISVLNPAPQIAPVSPITVKAGGKGDTKVEATDGTTSSSQLVYTLDPNAPEWVTLDGNTLRVEPGKGVTGATYMIAVTVTDELGAFSTAQVPVVVTKEDVESGITMGTLLGIMLVFLLIAIAVAVILSTRMGVGDGRPAKDKGIPARDKDYEDLYGDEPRRRKVRAVAKVDSEQVEVAPPMEEAPPMPVPSVPDYAAAAEAAGYAVTEEEPETEPPLPSWMSSTKAEEVHLEEKVVEPPPATPPEWRAPAEPSPDQPYKFRRPPDGQQPAFKGAGRPRQ